MTAISLGRDTLVFFFDETGEESYRDPIRPLYGLGGCAIMGEQLESVLREPWRRLRKEILGDEERHFHAVDFSRTAGPNGIQKMAKFFSEVAFPRLASVATIETDNRSPLETIDLVSKVLQNRIVDIAKWQPFDDIALIFESSERTNRKIEGAFAGFELRVGESPVKLECYFMDKRCGEPGLEVADFVMHAVGRQARRSLSGNSGFEPDFAATFHGTEKKLTSYMLINGAGEPVSLVGTVGDI